MPLSLARLLVSPVPGARHQGKLLAGPLRIACALGARGIVRDKREGDGGTPAGRFRLQQVLYRADRVARPVALLPRRRLRRDDGWCDDPASPSYNRCVRLPFAAGHERLWREDGLYDIIVVTDHNTRPRIRGRGSAVFFHLARPDLAPTAGCIAVSRPDMRRLLPRLSPRTVMVVG
jgi:L,D-peptidoglycan transpeptidase YkuD (ErfK/YbiS/YcfS/YnhG family)